MRKEGGIGGEGYQEGGVGSSDGTMRLDEGWLQLCHLFRCRHSDSIISAHGLLFTCSHKKAEKAYLIRLVCV